MVYRGDIIAVRGKGLLSRMISDFSGPISHVGLATDDNGGITQALTTVRTVPLAQMLSIDKYAYALHPMTLSPDQIAMILLYALSHTGEQYNYADLAYQAADIICRTDYFTQHYASNSKVICSEYVARAYAAAGLNFGVPSRSVTPTEIFDYALANPAKYSIKRLK